MILGCLIMEETLDFGEALVELRSGEKLQRIGWNGRGMFVVLQKAYPTGIAVNKQTADALGIDEGSVERFAPYLMMRTADGAFVPWVASQTDLLADDWRVLP